MTEGGVGRVEPDEIPALHALARSILPGAGVPRAADSWVARDPDGRVVGWLELRRVADEVHVLGLGVEASCRRRGLATALLDVALAGAALVHLEVRAGNAPARRMYARLGFDEVGVRPAYYADGDAAILLSRDAA